MKFTMLNGYLATLEYVLLNEKRDQFLDFGFLTAEIKKRLVLFGSDLSNVDEHINLFGQMIRSEELKCLLRSEDFHQVYEKSLSLPPFFHGGVEKLFNPDFWTFLENSKTYKAFINSNGVKQFKLQLDRFIKDELPLLLIIYTRDLPKIFVGFMRTGSLANEVEILPLSKCTKKNTVAIVGINKQFEFSPSQITEKRIKLLLEKYLVDSDLKKEFIKDSIASLKDSKEVLFTWSSEAARNLAFNYITIFLMEYEFKILNDYVRHKTQNTYINQLFTEMGQLFRIDYMFLFYALILVLMKGSINPVLDDFDDFWHVYLDLLKEDHQEQYENEKHKQLQEALKRVQEIVGMNPIALNPVQQKKKLPCYNYLFSALLHEKARRTGDDFVRLCREAADTFIDRNGKEFTGEQLANVFHITVKKYGGWPGFYENNKEKIKKLKKEINWQE